jgi:hypothetical protein
MFDDEILVGGYLRITIQRRKEQGSVKAGRELRMKRASQVS